MGLSNSLGKISHSNFCHTRHTPTSLPSVPSASQISKECSFCRNFSHQVYSIWVCLTPNCSMFWRNPEGKEFLPNTLQYNSRFLALTSQHPLSHGLRLLPPPAITRAMNGISTGYAFTRGIHCTNCGRLTCR